MSQVTTAKPSKRRKLFVYSSAFAALLLVVAGVFASNDWFPRSDPFSGKRFGWFGQPLAKNAPSAWNPLPSPTPTPTPYQLSKELVYAGSRLLTVEDKNATAVPPADLAIWRPGETGVWYVRITGETWTTQNWGQTGDIPVPGDFDGDGTTDFSIWRPGNQTWYVIHSSDLSMPTYAFGAESDIPAPADYDGDGKTDIAVWRETDGTFYVLRSSDGGFSALQWGAANDYPVASYDTH